MTTKQVLLLFLVALLTPSTHAQSHNATTTWNVTRVVEGEVEDERDEVERRLGLGVRAAFALARSTHLGVPADSDADGASEAAAQVLEMEREDDVTVIHFVATFAGHPVPAKVVVDDLSRLSPQQISAILHYPVLQVLSQSQADEEQPRKWWIIAIAVGGALSVLAGGWFLLFIYYNTCGRPILVQDTSPIVSQAFEDKIMQTEADTPHEPTDDKRRHGRVRTTRAENHSSPAREQIAVEVLQEANDSPPNLVDETKAEEKDDENVTQRPTELIPEQRPKLERTNGGAVTEIQSFSSSTSSLSPPPGPIPKSWSKRPKSAGLKRPTRTVDGREVRSFADDDWTIYTAGDKVSSIYGIQPIVRDERPRPILPTKTGIIEVTSFIPNPDTGVVRYL